VKAKLHEVVFNVLLMQFMYLARVCFQSKGVMKVFYMWAMTDLMSLSKCIQENGY